MRLKRQFKLVYGKAVVMVRVFPSITALQSAVAEEVGEERCERMQAVTLERLSRKGSIRVWFAADALRLAYIAHEAVHVAYAIGRRGINPWQPMIGVEEEERIAYPTGDLTSAIYASITGAGWQVQP